MCSILFPSDIFFRQLSAVFCIRGEFGVNWLSFCSNAPILLEFSRFSSRSVVHGRPDGKLLFLFRVTKLAAAAQIFIKQSIGGLFPLKIRFPRISLDENQVKKCARDIIAWKRQCEDASPRVLGFPRSSRDNLIKTEVSPRCGKHWKNVLPYLAEVAGQRTGDQGPHRRDFRWGRCGLRYQQHRQPDSQENQYQSIRFGKCYLIPGVYEICFYLNATGRDESMGNFTRTFFDI